ncbi:hypothetical protein [Mucilaginibacter sp.]|uniref:hypothetical protein n=1 Tax=Mucilaginibacter sp. TaxID=1882438 RepID=UPI003266CDB5
MSEPISFNLFADVKTKLDKPATTPTPPLPDTAGEFLGKLSMLQGVPVHYLIPNERFLQINEVVVNLNKFGNIIPEESAENAASTIKIEQGALKLFYIDPEWVQCLLNGALSVSADDGKELLGMAMKGDFAALVHYNEVKDGILRQISNRYTPAELEEELKKRLEERNLVYKSPTPSVAQTDWRYSGFIIRSSIISSWTGVEVIASGKLKETDTTVSPRRVIRVDKLANNTVLCICEGIITDVEITQPGETIYMDTKQLTTGAPQRERIGVLDISKIINPTPHLLHSQVENSAKLTESLLSKPLKTKLTITRKIT